jgi:uncharacterized SAM-binding protein YcdF (DUF218 family)
MTLIRSIAAWTVAVVLAMTVYLSIVIVGNVLVGAQTSDESADVIVVMGAAQYDGVPSPLLEGRLQAALDLWRDGRAPLIAVTGGKQEGDRFTEAAASRRWLLDRGVPSASILSEDAGRSTFGSLELLAPVLRAEGLSHLLIVSDSWHLPRSVLSARELGFAVRGAAVSPGRLVWSGDHSMREAMGVAAGRLIGFGRLLDITG